MKAILYMLLRAFKLKFELTVKHEVLTSRIAIVQRPFVASKLDAGPQLPVSIKPAVA